MKCIASRISLFSGIGMISLLVFLASIASAQKPEDPPPPLLDVVQMELLEISCHTPQDVTGKDDLLITSFAKDLMCRDNSCPGIWVGGHSTRRIRIGKDQTIAFTGQDRIIFKANVPPGTSFDGHIFIEEEDIFDSNDDLGSLRILFTIESPPANDDLHWRFNGSGSDYTVRYRIIRMPFQ